MADKERIVNMRVRACGECPFLMPLTTMPAQVGQSHLSLGTSFPHDIGGDPNTAITWFLCRKGRYQITNFNVIDSRCKLVEVTYTQKEELSKAYVADPWNNSPHQVGKGPTRS